MSYAAIDLLAAVQRHLTVITRSSRRLSCARIWHGFGGGRELVVRRWAVEITFAEVRRHLGIEIQRQRSDTAIACTTPALLGLFSLVALWAGEVLNDGWKSRCAA